MITRNAPAYSVSALTTYIRQVLDADDFLQNVWVEGELSDFKRHTSGHWYFTLKDNASQMKAVMWKTSATRQRFIPQHGAKVRAHGRISVYEVRGDYQLYCDEIVPLDEIGDLHARFRELWETLEAEGLFSPEIKRPLPPFPLKIGVVTSPSTAAFQDIQNVLRRRYPIAEVILSATPVQGAEAAPQIAAALRRVDDYGVDVILLARGGGSLEDLWCFNDEKIARAIRETRAPVVTGVGHETDTTLVDGTADFRAPTPSAGAEVLTPDIQEVRERLHELGERITDAARYEIQTWRDTLEDVGHKLRLVSPAAQIRNNRQRLDDLDSRMTKTLQNRLNIWRQQLRGQTRALDLANPTNLLGRGYALVTRTDDNKRLTDAKEVELGTSIQIQLAKGQLTATIKERNLDE